MLWMIEGLPHEPGERNRPVLLNLRANDSDEIGIPGVHSLKSLIVKSLNRQLNDLSCATKSFNSVETDHYISPTAAGLSLSAAMVL